MFSSANVPGLTSGLNRRALLGFLAIATMPISKGTFAATQPTDPTTTIEHLNQALLAAMKTGEQSDFNHRFNALAPAIDQAFDLPAVLAVSVGSEWANLSTDQKSRLLDAFRRYTVASYVANFDKYNGQRFSVAPDTRNVGNNRVMVATRITPVSGDATELDYVMLQTPLGWKVVDVLAMGSISRVAVQRSDFRHLLARGGGSALVMSLDRKTSDLSGGAIA